MSKRNLILTLLAGMLVFGVSGFAQQSLGDLARQLRDQRAKSEKKPAKVFTNDNLPARPPSEGRTAAAGMSDAAKSESTTASAASTTAAPAASPAATTEKAQEDKKKTKDYWQGKFKAAREAVAKGQEDQQVAEDELNLLQLQRARELNTEAQQGLDAKITSKSAEVETVRAAANKAKQALADLEKEFGESGAPDEWSKSD